MRLGQAHMMEYILLTVFIIILMVAFMILMTTFQIGGMQSQASENNYKLSLVVTRFMINTPYLNDPKYPDGSVLDDSKLTVVNCTDLKKVVGKNWFAYVKIPSDEEIICDETTYPDCNSWVICEKGETRIETCVHEVPVNVFRKLSNNVDIGTLTVGVYGKCA